MSDQPVSLRQLPFPRTGIGFDVHAYASEEYPEPLWLGGVLWDRERGLSGHSDGDPAAQP
jgi:2-C-methyl-D-erythritol 2,4-cyclodiphosphate synthase